MKALYWILALYATGSVAFPFDHLVARQEDQSTSNVAETTSAEESAKETGTASPASSATDEASSETADASTTTEDEETTSTGSKKPSTTRKPGNNRQMARLIMETPAITDDQPLYKVGEQVTLVWNYTDLRTTPAALNVEIFSKEKTYTVTGNLSAEETSIVWDTGEYATDLENPMIVGVYTLAIYDAASKRTDQPTAGGMLIPYQNLYVGMYTGRAKQDLEDWECATCDSGGISVIDSSLVRMLTGTTAIFIITFIWFVKASA